MKRTEGLSGKDLCSVLLKCLTDYLKLHIDGVGAVTGHIDGLSAHILQINSKSIYMHCHSHNLNLTVSTSYNIQSDRNVFNKNQRNLLFFNYTETRLLVLDSNLAKYAETNKTKVKNVG